MFSRILRKARQLSYPLIESVFRKYENAEASRGKTLEKIPNYTHRLGGIGTTTYGEWCYTIGLFQGIINSALPTNKPVHMLDVGCGTGRLLLSASANFSKEDLYTGIDIDPNFIQICKNNYGEEQAHFVHYEAHNAYYSSDQTKLQSPWPLEEKKFNFITALSVWTHLKEEDWKFYISEVARVLQPEGRALISFFILDEHYENSLPLKNGDVSEYYPQPKNKWVFDAQAYNSKEWFYPSWASVPEVAIGVRYEAFEKALTEVGLKIDKIHVGSWKDKPGLFFQDIVELSKM